jgi:hypothetical protein
MIDDTRSGRKTRDSRIAFPPASRILPVLAIPAVILAVGVLSSLAFSSCVSESRSAQVGKAVVSPYAFVSASKGGKTQVLSMNKTYVSHSPTKAAQPSAGSFARSGSRSVLRLPVVRVQALAQAAPAQSGAQVVDATSSASVKEPWLSHQVAGHEQCLSCHSAAKASAGAKAVPADHVGRTDDLCLYCHPAAEGAAVIPPLPEKPTSAFCLGCHGPFDALSKRSSEYVSEQGEKANPHLYIPHDSKQIAKCVDCHDTHPLPVTEPENIAKPGLQYCYSCHHEENFEPCAQCHKN